MSSRDKAATFLKMSDYSSARDYVEEQLKSDPANHDLHGLLALAMEGLGEHDAAQDAFEKALRLASNMAWRMRYAGNYAAYLIDLGHDERARNVVNCDWDWSVENGAIPELVSAAVNLAKLLKHLTLEASAVKLLQQVAQISQMDFDQFKFFIELLSELGSYDEANRNLKAAHESIASHEDFICLQIYVASRLRNDNESQTLISAYKKNNPVYLSPRPHQGKIGIVIINSEPAGADFLKERVRLHFSGNFPPQLVHLFSDRYVFDSIFVNSSIDAAKLLPRDRPSVCLNNFTNAELLRTENTIQAVTALEDSIGLPVVNSAIGASRTTRQMNAVALRDIKGVIVPKIQRYHSSNTDIDQLVKSIETEFEYPLILRGTREQVGVNMYLCSDRNELKSHILSMRSGQIYVVEFTHKAKHDGIYRKIRAAFVDGEPIIIRSDYSPHWKIHSRYRYLAQPNSDVGYWAGEILNLYKEKPSLLKQTNEMIENPDSYFGTSLFEGLRKIAVAIPLNIFGLDFDVSESGEIIFFEANATMNLFPVSDTPYPFPKIASERLASALHTYFERLAFR